MNDQPPTSHLSERARELLEYIAQFHAKNHYGPTFRQIKEALGWSTTSLVDNYVQQLELRGLVTRVPRHPHSLQPTHLVQGMIR